MQSYVIKQNSIVTINTNVQYAYATPNSDGSDEL